MYQKLIFIAAISLALVGCQPATPQQTEPDTEELSLPPEISDGLPTNDAAGGIMPAGTPLPEDAPTVEYVKVALASKYPAGEMDAAEIEVVEETDEHFYGIVKPADRLEGQTGGGYVYAVKTETGDWEVVADGQGSINCDVADLNDFPTSMISECLDENTGEVVQR
jgi:hypothetical protein